MINSSPSAFKQCSRCGDTESLDHFGKFGQSLDGLSFSCKQCVSEDNKRRYRERQAAAGKTVRDPSPERVARGPVPVGHKWCPDCNTYRPLDEFPRNRGTRDGRAVYCKPHQNERTYASRQTVHGGSRHYHLVRRYGVTAAQIDEMVDVQPGLCLICLNDLGDRPHVDHDHETGEVRGILCFNCNGGLGQFQDEPFLLKRAAGYLEGTMLAMLKGENGAYRIATEGWRPAS